MAKAKKKDTNKPNDAVVKTFLVTALVALPLGYVVGTVVADSDDETATSQTDQSGSDESEMKLHAHEQFEVESVNAPSISALLVSKDAKSGWNLSIQTNNFRFSPKNASGMHVDGEGHAHIYVDGEKITRLYSSDYYLGDLGPGSHDIRVTLNTNDHKDYTVNGRVVEATRSISEDNDDAEVVDDHSHSHDDDGHTHSH